MYPRKYKALGEKHISPTHGFGTVVKFDAFREPGSKQKFWTYTVSYANNDGTTGEEKITVPAKETAGAIDMFPECSDLAIKLAMHAYFCLHHLERIMQLQQAIKGKFEHHFLKV